MAPNSKQLDVLCNIPGIGAFYDKFCSDCNNFLQGSHASRGHNKRGRYNCHMTHMTGCWCRFTEMMVLNLSGSLFLPSVARVSMFGDGAQPVQLESLRIFAVRLAALDFLGVCRLLGLSQAWKLVAGRGPCRDTSCLKADVTNPPCWFHHPLYLPACGEWCHLLSPWDTLEGRAPVSW